MKDLVNTIQNTDCLGENGMNQIKDKSIDLILCDPPYQATRLDWDIALDFKAMWQEYERIIKDNGAIILFSIQPFSSKLVQSNMKLFRYEIIWQKSYPTGFLNAKKMPLKSHENILVFYKHLPTYNPQNLTDCHIVEKARKKASPTQGKALKSYIQTKTGYPRSVCKFKKENGNIHPTQKPLALIEYLIRTYSNEEDLILDNCMGSGTTAIAAMNENRMFIGFEKDQVFYEKAMERINLYRNHAA